MTFEGRRNRLTTHFSERIPVDKQRVSVLRPCSYIYIYIYIYIQFMHFQSQEHRASPIHISQDGSISSGHFAGTNTVSTFLGDLRNNRLQKAVTSVTTVCLTARNNSAPARWIFMAKLLEYFHCQSVALIFVNVSKTELCFGVMAKLRNATVSFVMSGRLCVSAQNYSAPTGRIFMKFDI